MKYRWGMAGRAAPEVLAADQGRGLGCLGLPNGGDFVRAINHGPAIASAQGHDGNIVPLCGAQRQCASRKNLRIVRMSVELAMRIIRPWSNVGRQSGRSLCRTFRTSMPSARHPPPTWFRRYTRRDPMPGTSQPAPPRPVRRRVRGRCA